MMNDELFTVCDRTAAKHCLAPVCNALSPYLRFSLTLVYWLICCLVWLICFLIYLLIFWTFGCLNLFWFFLIFLAHIY